MRIFLASILAIGICGCTKVKKDPEPVAQKSEQQQTKKPSGRMPGGVAGMILPGEEEPVGGRNQNQNNPPPQPAPEDDKTIPNEDARIVEWPKYKNENPSVVEVDPKVEGFDPFSAAASAYVNIPARIETLTGGYNARLQSQINAIEGGGDPKPLSYSEFLKSFAQAGGKLKNQPRYRLYGYNPQTGKVVILEDKAMKKRIYEEKGIPWDE